MVCLYGITATSAAGCLARCGSRAGVKQGNGAAGNAAGIRCAKLSAKVGVRGSIGISKSVVRLRHDSRGIIAPSPCGKTLLHLGRNKPLTDVKIVSLDLLVKTAFSLRNSTPNEPPAAPSRGIELFRDVWPRRSHVQGTVKAFDSDRGIGIIHAQNGGDYPVILADVISGDLMTSQPTNGKGQRGFVVS